VKFIEFVRHPESLCGMYLDREKGRETCAFNANKGNYGSEQIALLLLPL
jgi:hypothetical protein